MKNKVKRIIAAICAVMVVVTVFGACGNKPAENAEQVAGVMRVNGKDIDVDIFQNETNMMGMNCVQSLLQVGMITDISQLNWDAQAFETAKTYKEYVKDLAKTNLTAMYALIAEGEKKGITLTEEDEKEVADYIAGVKENYGDTFAEELKINGFSSEESFVKTQKMEFLYQKIREDASKDLSKYVSIEELKANQGGTEKVTVKHILVAYNEEGTGDATDSQKAAAKDEAEEVLKKLNDGGDFDALMAEYNDDPGATAEGYTFANDGTMVQEFADASFALEIGGTSGLVETPYGYHIIRRMERSYTVDEYMEYLAQKADVKMNDENYAKIAVTIDFATMLGK